MVHTCFLEPKFMKRKEYKFNKTFRFIVARKSVVNNFNGYLTRQNNLILKIGLH